MHSVQCHVGRLVEVQLGDVRSAEEILVTRRDFATVVERLAPRPVIIAADYRGINILHPAAADEFLENFKFGTSSRVERSALLIDPERATFMMQVERLIREANSALRKSFRVPSALEDWLADVLTAEERLRLRTFLHGP